jgi:exodeoxyribonuclease VII small subunit
MTQAKTLDFEAALVELEKVVGELDGEVKLERALELFEKGMKLSVDCDAFLKSAEQKIEILRKTASGEVVTEKFDAPVIAADKVDNT